LESIKIATNLSVPFFPYHFVQYHFVRSPLRGNDINVDSAFSPLVLSAINEDHCSVPALLTDYILRGMACPFYSLFTDKDDYYQMNFITG